MKEASYGNFQQTQLVGDIDTFNPDILQLLGYASQVALDDQEWRKSRVSKTRRTMTT